MYKIFESDNFDNIKLELEDILQEIKDEFRPLSNRYENLPIDIKYTERGDKDLISIRIGNQFAHDYDFSIYIKKIKDTLIRINDYMESEEYKFGSFSWDYGGKLKYSFSEFGMKSPFENIFRIGETQYLALFYTKKVNTI